MAYIANASIAARPSSLSRMFTAIGKALVAYAEFRSRHGEIAALERLSDEDLAARGLTRDTILRHVFSDTFYL